MKLTNNKHSRCLRLGLCLAGWFGALASTASAAQQDAEFFFHQGARQFLATNELAQARQTVTNGLSLYPEDPKLKKLWELLNQKQDQQQQQQDQQDQKDQQDKQDQKDQQSKDQQSKDQQKKDQEKKDQEKKSEEQKKQEQAAKDEKEKQEQEKKKAQQGEKKDQGENAQENEGSPQQAAFKMTPQQAMQLLESLKAEEKAMPFRPILKTNRQDRIFKDW